MLSLLRSRFLGGFVHLRFISFSRNAATDLWRVTMDESTHKKGAQPQEDEADTTLNETVPKKHDAASFKKKRNKKRKKKNEKLEPESADQVKKPQKMLPNYFLGVQITNPIIKGGMKALQDNIVKHDKRLRQTVVNVKSAHLTLAVLYLPDEESVSQACDVLKGCREKLDAILGEEAIVLDVSSIGTFGGKVLFAKVKPGTGADKLNVIAELVDKEFEAHKSSNNFDYKPHITLMKLSKAPQLRKKVRRIETSYYEKLENVHLGIQKAESLQLLAMLKNKQADGYYHCECAVLLDPDATDSNTTTTDDFAAFISGYNIMCAYCEIANSIPPQSHEIHLNSGDGVDTSLNTSSILDQSTNSVSRTEGEEKIEAENVNADMKEPPKDEPGDPVEGEDAV